MPLRAMKPVSTPEIDAFARGPWLRELMTVQNLLDRQFEATPSPSTLDAGCGSSLAYTLPEQAHRTGIDLSALQLERNEALDVKIKGDVQAHEFPPDSFDVIFCWDLLEHLPNPELALRRLRQSLKPGGMLVIGIPNLFSVKGLVTKLTPHRTHVWFYRVVLRSRSAGIQDAGPFPTHLRYAASPPGLRKFAEAQGLRVERLSTYEGPVQRRVRQRLRLEGLRWRILRTAMLLLSGGLVDAAATDAVVVLRDPRTVAGDRA